MEKYFFQAHPKSKGFLKLINKFCYSFINKVSSKLEQRFKRYRVTIRQTVHKIVVFRRVSLVNHSFATLACPLTGLDLLFTLLFETGPGWGKKQNRRQN